MEQLFEYNPDTKTYRELNGIEDIHLSSDTIFWDTETTGLSWIKNRVFCHSFGELTGPVYIIVSREKVGSKYEADAEQGPVTEFLLQMLEDPELIKWIYNAKFDALMVRQDNCIIQNEKDAFILMKLFPKYMTAYKLKEHVAVQFLGMNIDAKDEIEDFFKNRGNPSAVPRQAATKYIYTIQQGLFTSDDDKVIGKAKIGKIKRAPKEKGDKEYISLPEEILVPYAAEDIVLLRETVKKCLADGKEHYENIKELLEIENYIQRNVVKEMEIVGCAVDVPLLKSEQPVFEAKATEALNKFFELSGLDSNTFDVMSADHLKDFYYRKCKEPLIKYTKAARELDKKELEALTFEKRLEYASVDKWALMIMKHPSVQPLLDFNKFDGIADGFIPNLIENSYAEDGGFVTHASFNQLGAVSGRLSCSAPNLENLPNPKEEADGLVLRKAIIARPGYKILSIDESQIEYRMFAHYTKSKKLIQGFIEKKDYHQLTADIINKSRKDAKTVNFGTIYGMGLNTLSDKLGCPVSEARRIMEALYGGIPEFKTLQYQIREVVKQRGFVRTILGRRCYLQTKFAYQGLNRIIQGGAADLFKKAIMLIHIFLKENNLKTRMINLVHDEILFELHDTEHWIIPTLCKIMIDVGDVLIVPLDVNVEIGSNWGEMEEITI